MSLRALFSRKRIHRGPNDRRLRSKKQHVTCDGNDLGEVLRWDEVRSMDSDLNDHMFSLIAARQATDLQALLHSLSIMDCCRLANERSSRRQCCPGQSYVTPLTYAISQGDIQTASVLLNFGADPAMIPCVSSDEDGAEVAESSAPSSRRSSMCSTTSSSSSLPLPSQNHLQFALSQNSQPEIVWLLLENGDNTSQLMDTINSAVYQPVLDYTARCTDRRLATFLIHHTPPYICASVSLRGFKRSLLHMAIIANNLPVVESLLHKLILDEMEDIDELLSAVDQTGKTPLIYAVDSGNVTIVELLLSQGADTEQYDGHGRTPLHFAVRKRSIVMVKRLLEAGADACHRTIKGLLPMDHLYNDTRWSLRRKSDESVRTLRKILDESVRTEVSIMEALLHASIDQVDFDMPQFRHIAFHLVENGSDEEETILLRLLQRHSDYVPKVLNKAGEPLLHVAAASGKTQTLLWLLQIGGAVTRQDDDRGWLAIHHACLKGDPHSIALLTFQDPDCVNLPTMSFSTDYGSMPGGYTPLWLLLRYGHADLAAQCIQNWSQLKSSPDLSINTLRMTLGKAIHLPRTLLNHTTSSQSTIDRARAGKKKVTMTDFAQQMGYTKVVQLLTRRCKNDQLLESDELF